MTFLAAGRRLWEDCAWLQKTLRRRQTMTALHLVKETVPQGDRVRLFAKAEEIASDLARRGAQLDAEGKPPLAEIDRLKQEGLLTALHPVEIGGGGLDWVDGLRLVRILARGESSIGQLLGYHFVNSQYIYWAADDPDKAWNLGAETVEKRLYWGAAVNPRDPGLTLTRSGDHYLLNGRKTFSTGAHVSDRINANAAFGEEIANIVLPTDRPGYIANDDWDNIGQRLSDSGSVEFRDFPVYESDFLLPLARKDAAPPVQATFNTPLIQLVFVNFYLGTAEGALAAATDYVRTTTRPWVTSGLEKASDDPYILERGRNYRAVGAGARQKRHRPGTRRGGDRSLCRQGQRHPCGTRRHVPYLRADRRPLDGLAPPLRPLLEERAHPLAPRPSLLQGA
jgi:alkylation response protein AidB-like acyl-CoA dehydrogenase